MPTVAVDLSQLAPEGRNGGAARFVLDLLASLSPAFDLVLLVRRGSEGAVSRLEAVGARVAVLGAASGTPEPRWSRRVLRRLPPALARFLPDEGSLRRLGADVLFSPLQSAAFHEPGLPHVAVAYDLQELHHPGFFTDAEKRRRARFRSDLARCDRIVSISASTADELVRRAGIRPERLSVTHPAGPTERRALGADALRAELAPLGLEPGKFALYPANFWPHKNHERLLRAVSRSPLAHDPYFRLVLCGALDTPRDELRRTVSSLGVERCVLLLPYQPDATMTALLQAARFLAFPSLFEGFGIPVVEAFRLGVPVACSDIPALREVAGEAALFFDPLSVVAIRNAIEALWSASALHERLSAAGRSEASRFPAGEVAGRYAEVLSGATRTVR